MATSKEERILLDCPICFENFNDPKYLPCLHTFCELCIESFIDSSILDCNVNHREKSFNCPVCRLVNRAPYQSISAKELQNNYQKTTRFWPLKICMRKATIQRVRCYVTIVHKAVSKLLQHIDVNHVELTYVKYVASVSIKR